MGSFGRVLMALSTNTGQLMAVKQVPILKFEKAQQNTIDVSNSIIHE